MVRPPIGAIYGKTPPIGAIYGEVQPRGAIYAKTPLRGAIYAKTPLRGAINGTITKRSHNWKDTNLRRHIRQGATYGRYIGIRIP